MCDETFPGRPEWKCDREGPHTLCRNGNIMWDNGSWVVDRHDATSGGEH